MKEFSDFEAALSIKNVSFSYNTHATIENLSLDVEKGNAEADEYRSENPAPLAETEVEDVEEVQAFLFLFFR